MKKPLIAAAALSFLAACNPSAPPDAYDVSKMDLKSPPAKVTAERHTGAFAEGSALSMGAWTFGRWSSTRASFRSSS